MRADETREPPAAAKAIVKGNELFIVDNSDSDWKVLNYLRDWTDLAHTFDVATGYFDIGGLLALDGQASACSLGILPKIALLACFERPIYWKETESGNSERHVLGREAFSLSSAFIDMFPRKEALGSLSTARREIVSLQYLQLCP